VGLPFRTPPLSDILTKRLVLEPWEAGRREDFARAAAIPEVVRYIGSGRTWSRAQADKVFDRNIRHWHEHGFGWRSAVERDTGAWLGFLGLNHVPDDAVDSPPDDVEIGWWLLPEAWGRGLATEGAAAVRDEAFERVGLERIVGRYDPRNTASGRIMEKLGMRYERDGVTKHGGPVRIFVLEREDWAAAAERVSQL
jgi:RimJ/RimL family protein N-acetyltransferase